MPVFACRNGYYHGYLQKNIIFFVVEDAAQGMMSTYKGKTLGTI